MKVAVIGVGGIGKTHVNNIRAMEGVRITDICDPNPAVRVLARELGAVYYDDYRALAAHTRAEVVLICTPTFLHAEQIRAVLSAGKCCICEKPLCLNAQEARALFTLADRQGVQLLAAHVLLFWPEYALLARLVREQTYGRALDASLSRLSERPVWSAGGWMFDRDKSGLLPFDLHIHDLYFIISLFGKPDIDAVQSGGRSDALHAEYLRACYAYPGLTVCAEASWYQAPIAFTQAYRVYFERALVIFDGERVTAYEPGLPASTLYHKTREGAIGTSVNLMPTTAFRSELDHFFDCVGRNAPSDMVPRAQVIDTIEVLEAIAQHTE